MFAAERRQRIADLTRELGRVESAALCERFGVNPETVRRDLHALQSEGLVQRVHGGAVATGRLAVEPRVTQRGSQMRDEKVRIAKLAAEQLPEAGSIFIESGSTAAWLAELLPERSDIGDLLVITNALPVALRLADHSNLTVMTVGGRVRAATFAEVDSWALDRLASLRIDVAFVGTNAIDLEWGLSTPDPAEGATKRAVIDAARRSVLLADSSKVGRSFLTRYARLSDVDALITDDGMPEVTVEAIAAQGVDVQCA